ncbi:helix-turn-helix domain-containing protein [Flavobacterium sp.]|uniref:helix-turn-helix domain-containing protein n=1 Tax=Flavobacterium sp. TaxID=239 RepID=UPI0037BF8F1A
MQTNGKPLESNVKTIIIMDVGTKISILRRQNKMSQPELAFKLDISQTSLSEIESGKTRKIDFFLMDKICALFDVDFDYFLEEKSNNKIKKPSNCNIGCTNGTVNNTIPEGLLERMLMRIEQLERKLENK